MSDPQPADAQTEYRSLSAYMDMREGHAAPDDVTLAASAPADTPDQTDSDAPPEAEAAPNPPEIPVEVSDAAKTLSQHANESRAQKRQREIQEQIGRETARKHAAKSEADVEEARLATLRAERARLEAAPRPAPVPQPVAPVTAPAVVAKPQPTPPKWTDIGTPAMPDADAYDAANRQYHADIAGWYADEAERKATAAVDKRLAADRQEREASVIDHAAQARLEVARAKYPDFDATVFGNQQLAIGMEMAALIRKDPIGWEVAKYLGDHPLESQQIFRLDPLDQAAEFGRLKTVVSTPASPLPVAAVSQPSGPTPGVPVSKTLPPVPPVGGSSTSSQVPTERRSPADYVRSKNAELDQRGRLS